MNSHRFSRRQIGASSSKLAASISHNPMPTIPTLWMGSPTYGYSLGATSQEASHAPMDTPRSRSHGSVSACRPGRPSAADGAPTSCRRLYQPSRINSASPSVTRTPCASSAASRSAVNTGSPASSQSLPLTAAISSKTPRVMTPFFALSMAPAVAFSAEVTRLAALPLYILPFQN